MQTTYDYAVFIGRFQPFHIGHLHVFTKALQSAEQLLVLVGSSGGARTLRNPFTYDERVTIMRQSLPESLSQRITFLPLLDYTYNDSAWVQAVTESVDKAVSDPAKTVALVGHDKDETTYYLKLFPHWAYIEVSNLDGINATAVRKNYLRAPAPCQFDSEILPEPTLCWLRQFADTEHYQALAEEYRAIADYRAQWEKTPYPVIFTTVDALIKWRTEILLIKRKHYPGKGLYALPGGFLEADETLFDGCLRELSEETQLAVPRQALKAALITGEVFDHPKRSSRGRVISHCYYFDISQLPEKPQASAADDALSLSWLPIDALERSQLFEDHFFIIQHLLKE